MIQPRPQSTGHLYQNIQLPHARIRPVSQLQWRPALSQSTEFPNDPARVPRVNVMLRTTTLPQGQAVKAKNSQNLTSLRDPFHFMDSLPDPPSLPLHHLEALQMRVEQEERKKKEDQKRIVRRIQQAPPRKQEIEFTSTPAFHASRDLRLRPETARPIFITTLSDVTTDL
ncbi:unnamed protein product, partial [Mesorhabditis spiculigera]